jgi:hypothetical protein
LADFSSAQVLQKESEELKLLEEELSDYHSEYFNRILEALYQITCYKKKVQDELKAYKSLLESTLETTL